MRTWCGWSKDFHQVHERTFGIKEPGRPIECVYWRAKAIGLLTKPPHPRGTPPGSGTPRQRYGARERPTSGSSGEW